MSLWTAEISSIPAWMLSVESDYDSDCDDSDSEYSDNNDNENNVLLVSIIGTFADLSFESAERQRFKSQICKSPTFEFFFRVESRRSKSRCMSITSRVKFTNITL